MNPFEIFWSYVQILGLAAVAVVLTAVVVFVVWAIVDGLVRTIRGFGKPSEGGEEA